MIYCFDIDGTICTLTDGNYEEAQPITYRIDHINRLFNEEDNKIILHTARGMGRYNNDTKKAELDLRLITEKQLANWGVKYHELFMGKPAADMYIDDKGFTDEEFFGH